MSFKDQVDQLVAKLESEGRIADAAIVSNLLDLLFDRGEQLACAIKIVLAEPGEDISEFVGKMDVMHRKIAIYLAVNE